MGQNTQQTQLEEDEVGFFNDVFQEEFEEENDEQLINDSIDEAPEFGDETEPNPYLIEDPNDKEAAATYDEEDEESENDNVVDNVTLKFVSDILSSKGIEDPTKIKYQNDEGEIEEVSFYDLPYEEQIEILKSNDSDIDFGLNTDEIETVNILRHHGVTLEQLVDYYSNKAVNDYISGQSTEEYEVDSFTDDELFVLDLKSKYADLTDEDILSTIEHEKQNENLFKRKIDFLRNSYKEAEDLNKKQQLEEENKTKAAKEKEKEENLLEGSKGIVDIGGLDLEEEERDSTLKYILEKDITGKSEFEKAIDNPENQFKMAWFIKHGDEAFDILHNYYKNEIDKVRKSTWEKAKDEFSKKAAMAVKKQTTKPSPVSKIGRPTKSNMFGGDYVDQDDLFARSFNNK